MSHVIMMPEFGCCSQGFIFPHSQVLVLVCLYEDKHVGYINMLTEEYANNLDKVWWAIVPSILKHVGWKSSKRPINL